MSVMAPDPDEYLARQILEEFFVAADACTMCGGAKQVVEDHDCPRCNGTGTEPARTSQEG